MLPKSVFFGFYGAYIFKDCPFVACSQTAIGIKAVLAQTVTYQTLHDKNQAYVYAVLYVPSAGWSFTAYSSYTKKYEYCHAQNQDHRHPGASHSEGQRD